MKQPIRHIKKKPEKDFGIDYCNQCPFLVISETARCNSSDVELEYDNIEKIPVPEKCGNNKESWKKMN